MAMTPTSLKEISARVVKTSLIPFGPLDLPRTVIDYLSSANCCVNPKCQGKVLCLVIILFQHSRNSQLFPIFLLTRETVRQNQLDIHVSSAFP
jgi:hypothetical protein